MASVSKIRRAAWRWHRYTRRHPTAKVTTGAYRAARRVSRSSWHHEQRLAPVRAAIAMLVEQYGGADRLAEALLDDQRWMKPGGGAS